MGLSKLRKVPGLSGVFNELVGFGADIIQGGQASPTRTASNIAETIANAGMTGLQRPLDKLYNKLERSTGYGFGRPGVGEILNDPASALGQFLKGSLKIPGQTVSQSAWLPLLRNRPDPLWEIDWLCVLPGLPPEYVEDVSWTHPRISEEGVFRNGKQIHLATGVEIPAITVTLYEDRILTAQTWYNAWYLSIFDEASGTYNYPANYKKSISLVVRDVKQNAVGNIQFDGCFPIGSPSITHSADGGRVKVQIEISVDSIQFQSALVQDAEGTSSTLVDMIKGGLASNVGSFLGSKAISGALGRLGSFAQSVSKGFSNGLSRLFS